MREAGRQAVLAPGDISDEAHCRSLVERTVAELGSIDILVNNAAYQMTREGIEQIPDGEWDHTFKTNIFAMYYLCRAAWPHLQPGSTIINTASIQAYQPSPQLLPYASTKGAIVTFSKALAQEGAEKGIRVNVVAPGPVWTPLIPATMPEEKAQQFGQDTPLGSARPAGGAGPALRLPGLGRVQLHHRRGRGGDGRKAPGIGRVSRALFCDSSPRDALSTARRRRTGRIPVLRPSLRARRAVSSFRPARSD